MTLRVMSYNIRNARGLDNRVDVARIASVIAPFAPHILALQEVDVCRPRSGGVDQALELADLLGMTSTFEACIETATERYGIATLGTLPALGPRSIELPMRRPGRSEPRRALLTRHEWDGLAIEMVNTHLSVSPRERGAQMRAITGAFSEGLEGEHLIVAGDLNCTPWSAPFRALASHVRPANRSRTWPSRLPLLPLDHILCRGLEVVRAGTWRAGAARQASDHLPVFAELARAT